jgi:hypothetical protein
MHELGIEAELGPERPQVRPEEDPPAILPMVPAGENQKFCHPNGPIR